LEEQQHRNALPQGFLLNEYKIESVLGKPGGFGITYLAKDTHLEQWVAIKEYLPSDFALRESSSNTVHVQSTSYQDSFNWGLNCFIDEARVLAKFKHKTIVRVLRYFEANGTAYMVMEYEEGQSLAEYLKQKRFLTEQELLNIINPLLEGLIDIHNENLLHRDIKPDNIYIRKDNTPVLLDFGSARYAVGQKSRTVTSIVTPGYAPLEQYDNEGVAQGPWTDIYGLGAVMYQAISGNTPPAATRRVMKDPMKPATEVGEGRYKENLLEAIDWALQLNEEDRPQTVGQWRDKMFSPTVPSSTFYPSKEKLSIWTTISIVFNIVFLLTIGVLLYENHKLNHVEKELASKQKLLDRAYSDYQRAKAILDKIQKFDPDVAKELTGFEEGKKFYEIVGVKIHDVLNVREFPGHLNKKVTEIPATEKCIEFSGNYRLLKSYIWVKIKYNGREGWVNSTYLAQNSKCLKNKKDNNIEQN
jgi:serine/threonine protein kinase